MVRVMTYLKTFNILYFHANFVYFIFSDNSPVYALTFLSIEPEKIEGYSKRDVGHYIPFQIELVNCIYVFIIQFLLDCRNLSGFVGTWFFGIPTYFIPTICYGPSAWVVKWNLQNQSVTSCIACALGLGGLLSKAINKQLNLCWNIQSPETLYPINLL